MGLQKSIFPKNVLMIKSKLKHLCHGTADDDTVPGTFSFFKRYTRHGFSTASQSQTRYAYVTVTMHAPWFSGLQATSAEIRR